MKVVSARRLEGTRWSHNANTSNVLHQANRVVDGGVDIAGSDGVADPEAG